jgi:hypothetical protein
MFVLGDRVRVQGCAACATALVVRIADGQVLLQYPERRTWMDPERLERA